VAVGVEVGEEVGVDLLIEIGILGPSGADSSREHPAKNPKPTNPVKKVPHTKNRHDFIFPSSSFPQKILPNESLADEACLLLGQDALMLPVDTS
jgi:hypothetical protein